MKFLREFPLRGAAPVEYLAPVRVRLPDPEAARDARLLPLMSEVPDPASVGSDEQRVDGAPRLPLDLHLPVVLCLEHGPEL